jgi:hypothetical protein
MTSAGVIAFLPCSPPAPTNHATNSIQFDLMILFLRTKGINSNARAKPAGFVDVGIAIIQRI